MWRYTSIDQVRAEVLTAFLNGARIIKAGVAVLCAAALILPFLAYANGTYNTAWNTKYPASQSDDNASCQLCHTADTTTPEWNAYGYAIRNANLASADADLESVEGDNSDGDLTPATNLEEITSGTQPGWTEGANNSTYNAGGLITSTALPPGTITGNLDPAANTAPQGNIDTPAAPITEIAPGGSVNFTATATDAETPNTLTHDWNFGAGSGIANSNVEDPGTRTFNNPGAFQVTYTVSDGEFQASDTRTIIVSTPPQIITLDYDLYGGTLVNRADTPSAAEDTFVSSSICFTPVMLTETSNTLRLNINFALAGINESIQISAVGTGPNRPETFASRTAGDCADGINGCGHDFGPGMLASNSAGNLGDATTNMALNVTLSNAQGTLGGGFVNPFYYTAGTGAHGATPIPPPFACNTSAANECTVGAQFPDIVDGQNPVTFDGIVVDLVFGNSGATFAPVTVDCFQFNMLGGDLQIVPPIVDLSITKDDGVDMATPRDVLVYTIVVDNAGPSTAAGVTVEDFFPPVVDCTWTCAASGGSSCSAGPVSGDISDSITLLPGGSATYTASCNTHLLTDFTVVNLASVSIPDGTTDLNLDNNSSSDETLVVFPVQVQVPVLSLGGLAGLALMLAGLLYWRTLRQRREV